jgi:DNA-binding CsgD family transcriptional regulator/PAS domain-containing protein
MRTWTHQQRARLAALTTEIETLRLHSAWRADDVVSEACALLGMDSVGIYSVAETSGGWHFERYYVHADPQLRIREGMLGLFARRNVPVLFYDLARPAPEQRNRLIEATAMIDASVPGGWTGSALCREVLAPVGLGRQQQHRILLCDRSSLLAWFGAFHTGPLARWQQRTLHAIARPLRRRLLAERRLGAAPRSLAALDAALDNIGAPAFVVRASGAILTLNGEGRRLLESSRDVVRAALHDALRGRPTSISFDVTEIRDNGMSMCWLLVARPAPEVVLETALARATTSWQLTPRQSQVLDLVVRGLTNATIAAELALSARAVELHISALLARAAVANRAALVSAVLLA